MSCLRWYNRNNTQVLTFGNDILVQLSNQAFDKYMAIVLDEVFAINLRNGIHSVYTVTYKAKKIATLRYAKGTHIGGIYFDNKIKYTCKYRPKQGLSITGKDSIDDGIYYQNASDNKLELLVYIGIHFADLDIEKLLLLVTLGNLFYNYLEGKTNKEAYSISIAHLMPSY